MGNCLVYTIRGEILSLFSTPKNNKIHYYSIKKKHRKSIEIYKPLQKEVSGIARKKQRFTDRQKKFCQEYVKSGNATQSAIKAGYGKNTARQTGAEILSYPHIKEHIRKLQGKIKNKDIAEAQEIQEFLTRVMRRKEKEQVVVTLKKKAARYAPDETGKMQRQLAEQEEEKVVEIDSKLSDAIRAGELLGKRYQLFSDKAGVSEETQDDGFIEALKGEAEDTWEE